MDPFAAVKRDFTDHDDAQQVMRTTHDAFRACVGAIGDASGTEDADLAKWCAATEGNQDVLEAYAAAQHHMAATCWQSREVSYVPDTIRCLFYPPAPDRVCDAGTQALKADIAAYKQQHGTAMPPAAYAACITAINQSFAPPNGVVRMIDVGSCYNPFGRDDATATWLQALPVDLQPATPDVKACDWLKVNVTPACTLTWDDLRQASRISDMPPGVADAVVMSYLLSFLPSASLRLRACRNARDCLRVGGALIVVEARRGAHRVNSWPSRWTTTLEHLGFRRVRLDMMAKSAALVFVREAKVLPSAVGVSEEHDAVVNLLHYDNEV
jgi:hypothetical protein